MEIYKDMRFKELENQKEKENEAVVGVKDALFHPDYRGATWMGMWLAVTNQMSGINVLNVYAPTIFKNIKKTSPGGLSVEQDVFDQLKEFVI